jgi:hypothetical protein
MRRSDSGSSATLNSKLPVASIVLSISALAVAIYGRVNPAPAKPDPAQMRASVDSELQRRETELVTAWAPKFRRIFTDMLGENAKLDPRALNPKTLNDLFLPLLSIIEKMQGNEVGVPPQK